MKGDDKRFEAPYRTLAEIRRRLSYRNPNQVTDAVAQKGES